MRRDCWFMKREENIITEFGIQTSKQGGEREPKCKTKCLGCTPPPLPPVPRNSLSLKNKIPLPRKTPYRCKKK